MLVHPELVDILAALPQRPLDPFVDVAATRAAFRALATTPEGSHAPGLSVEAATLPGPDSNIVNAFILRPTSGKGTLPAVLYLHGGGFAFGEMEGPNPQAALISVETDAVVLDVHYRLAPEHPFPAGVEDCYAALAWLTAGAHQLNIDPRRVAIVGLSAGGCLGAALTLMARDRGGPSIVYQCLLNPCLDDRGATQSMARIVDRRFTDGPRLRLLWDKYLGANRGDEISAYAAPARAQDLSGLPPAYILTSGLDPLRDEALDYTRRLVAADVAVETHHVPGAWHNFEAQAPNTRLARETTDRWLSALRRALRA